MSQEDIAVPYSTSRIRQPIQLRSPDQDPLFKVVVNSSHELSDKHMLTRSYVTFKRLMNVCDTSFERAKTAVLCGSDVLDCISVPMEKIRLVFEPLLPGIFASITRIDREPGSRFSSLLDHRQRYCAETHRFL